MGDVSSWVVGGALACVMTVWAMMGFCAAGALAMSAQVEAGGWPAIEARLGAVETWQ